MERFSPPQAPPRALQSPLPEAPAPPELPGGLQRLALRAPRVPAVLGPHWFHPPRWAWSPGSSSDLPMRDARLDPWPKPTRPHAPTMAGLDRRDVPEPGGAL